jgi:Uma2 family endonuclease
MPMFTLEIPSDRIFSLRFEEQLTQAEFEDFCARHPELRVEREPDGQLTIMTPIHLLSGGQQADFMADLVLYARATNSGKAYSSNTGFTLPDGSVRAADGAFVSNEQLEGLTDAEKHSFAPVVPEFIIEVRSDTDSVGKLLSKMKEVWIKNGVRLAWLIDPLNRVSYIFRADGSEEVLKGFDRELSGEDVLPGFTFDLRILEVE